MIWGEFVALLVIVTAPESGPVMAGANVVVNVLVCPAAIVNGNAAPLTVNPAPLALICVTVTLEFPVFVSVTLCVALVPVVRLPKLSDAGIAVS